MHYYSHRPPRHYTTHLRPPLQAELTAMHHQSLLREQAELQRYYEVHCGLRATNYEAEILEKQRRIAELLKGRSILQRDRQPQLMLQSELQYQQMLREMELNSYLKDSRQNRISMEVRKDELASFRQFNSHELENNRQQTRQKQKLMKQYDMHSRRRAMSVSLPQSEQKYRPKERFELKEKVNNSQIVAPVKESPHAFQRKNISFSLQTQSKPDTKSRSPSKSPQNIKHIRSKSPKPKSSRPVLSLVELKSLSLKRIADRLSISKKTYKDSAWRNLKHQSTHLFSTFENESRLRRQLKGRINNTPAVIERYNIVVS